MILGKTSLNNKFSKIMVYSNSTKYSTQHISQNKNKTKQNKPKTIPKNNTQTPTFPANEQHWPVPTPGCLASSYHCQGILYDLHHIQHPYEDISNTIGHLQ